jgi:hypothetical protein
MLGSPSKNRIVIGLPAGHFFCQTIAALKGSSNSLSLVCISLDAIYGGGGCPMTLSMHALVDLSIVLSRGSEIYLSVTKKGDLEISHNSCYIWAHLL